MWKRKWKLEAEAVKAVNFFVEAEALWWKRLEAEANSEAKVLKRSWKRMHFLKNQTLPDFQTGYNRRGKM